MNAGTEKIFNAIKEVLNDRDNSIRICRLQNGTLEITIECGGGGTCCGFNEFDLEIALTNTLKRALRREEL